MTSGLRASVPLMTVEAMRAAELAAGVQSNTRRMPKCAVVGFLYFHATEGREALVETVAKAIAADCASAPSWSLFTEQAEKVVTALFGEADRAA